MSHHHTRIYSLTISGTLDDDFLSAYCPDGTTLVRCGDCTLLENLPADQAGILGLLRALHNLGLTVIKMDTTVERISQ